MIAYLRKQLAEIRKGILNKRDLAAIDALSRASDAVDHVEEQLKDALERSAEEFTERMLFYRNASNPNETRDVSAEVGDRKDQ